MSSREYLFLQKVVTNGDLNKSVLIEHVKSFAFIESGSADGNKIIMRLLDSAALYRDDFGIKKDAELTVSLADLHGKGDQSWTEKFIISKASTIDGLYEVEGFEKNCHQLKKPVDKPRFFTKMQPRDILKELLPDLRIESDNFERGATYHLNSGGTKARLIRSMARDFGSMFFISRGVVHFKSIKNLTMEKEFTLEHSNPTQADHSIANYQIIGEESMFERVLNREYVGWDVVDGIQKAGTGAKVHVSVPQAKALKNQCVGFIPVLDVELNGNTKFMPGKVCEVLFHKQVPAQELDETLPDKQVMTQVVHYQSGNRYQCRIDLGVRNL